MSDHSHLILEADENTSNRKIVMYRLTPLKGNISESPREDYYIAVPKGKQVFLTDLPGGSYELGILN